MNQKLHSFLRAAVQDHQHPVYKYAFRSPVLQYYAANVMLLASVTAEDWEKENPDAVTSMLEVMRLVEEDAAAEAGKDKRLEDAEKEIADLKAKVAALTPAAPTADATVAAPDAATVSAPVEKPAEA